jgi:hypothetical protein
VLEINESKLMEDFQYVGKTEIYELSEEETRKLKAPIQVQSIQSVVDEIMAALESYEDMELFMAKMKNYRERNKNGNQKMYPLCRKR